MRTPLGTDVEIVHDELAHRYAVLEDRKRIGTLLRVFVPTRRGRRHAWVVADAGPGVDREHLPEGYTFDPATAVQAILDARAAAERADDADGLTGRERALLDFERDHAFVPQTARVAAAEIRFNLSEWRYLQILNAMINAGPGSPYWRYAPDLLKRLEQQRDEQLRRGPRSARRHAEQRAAVGS